MNGYSTRSRSNGIKSITIPNQTLFEYPANSADIEPGRGVITFTRHDLRHLQSPNFLNDTIISFFMQFYLDHSVSCDTKSRIHVFNSFFFAKLKSIKDNKKNGCVSYDCVSRWLKGVEIFNKDFLIMPVCDKDHWLIIIVCYPARTPSPLSHSIPDDELYEPAVFVLNSFNGYAPSIKKTLNQFLRNQWLKERGTPKTFSIHNAKNYGIRLVFPELPQQKNSYDCGVYLLSYFYCFLSDPRGSYIKMFRRHSMKTWFKDNEVDPSRERRKMKTIINEQISSWSNYKKAPNGRNLDKECREVHILSTSHSSASSIVDFIDDSDMNEDAVITIN